MLKGYSLPLSPGGRSSLVPSPPWHYVGDFLVIEYWADPEAVRAVLPPGLEPHPTDPGRAAAIFADWQSCTDGGTELLDPARSQYMEFFIVVNAMLNGQEVTTCPYIWVDRDFALMRGWFQGFPKKQGSVWMTRHFGLQNGAEPGLQSGATFGGTLAANDRRLAQGTVTLENATETGPTHNDPQLVNVRHFPRLNAGLHDDAGGARAGGLAQPRPLDLGDLGGLGLARAVPRAQRGAHRARARAHGQGLPLHVRLHGRRPGRTRATCGRAADGDATAEHPRARVAGADVSVDHYIGGRRVASAADVRGSLAARLVAARRGLARRRRDRRSRRRRGGRRVPGLGRARRRGPRGAPRAPGRPDRRQRRAHRRRSSASTWRCSRSRCGCA